MEYQLEKVTLDKKEILYNLLQFALYDGSQYIKNELNEKGMFNYTWFDNYFTDLDREAYFIKSSNNPCVHIINCTRKWRDLYGSI